MAPLVAAVHLREVHGLGAKRHLDLRFFATLECELIDRGVSPPGRNVPLRPVPGAKRSVGPLGTRIFDERESSKFAEHGRVSQTI